jgi:orotate phosphoribosyltransferase
MPKPSIAMAGETKRSRLRDIIARRSIFRGEFKLASGGASNLFFDMKMTLLDPEGADLAADLILDALAADPVDAVGGLVIGACPIVSALSVKSLGRKGAPRSFFYVRKEPKDRGTRKLIEGNLEEGSRVAIVEDVTTEGNSALRAVAAVRELGCTVKTVVTVVDRLQGARDNLANNGVGLVSLFTRDDFSV